MPVSSCQSILIFIAGNVLKAVDEKTCTADLGSNALYYLLLRDSKDSHKMEGMNTKAEYKLWTLLLLIRYILDILMYRIEIEDTVEEENE